MVIGHQKGRDTKEKIHRNFRYAQARGLSQGPEAHGLAERFRLPLLTFIDTPGAYPGVGAEERARARPLP